ncbi:MAG: ExbD/TolR family protein [Planctomycetota bacterium]
MSFRIRSRTAEIRRFSDTALYSSFNMTPLIDIVFLLIIFFMVVCRFIEAENLPVSVPDDCRFAQRDSDQQGQITTVSITESDGEMIFAVDSEMVDTGGDLAANLARLIDLRLKDVPSQGRTVTLRIDKDVCYAQAQYALAGIAASSARDIELAAIKDKRPQ